MDSSDLERDPAKRKPMWDYPVNEREQVRRAYLDLGPYQIHLKEYPAKGIVKHPCRFQYSWFKVFPNWLEYSPATHSAYCFICYLFRDKPIVRYGSDAFTVNGFYKWKKVNDGKRCAFLKHIGCLQHKDAVAFSENLLNQTTHIGNMLEKQSTELVRKNRIRLKASVDIVRWLVFQACAFRGSDESANSRNRVCSMLKMFDATRVVLKGIMDDGSSCYAQKACWIPAYSYFQSICTFVIILHLMKEIMGKTDILCQALQKKFQDIFNAIELVSTTKESLHEFRNNGWNSFFGEMRVFCGKHQTEIPYMNAPYKSTRYRPRQQDNHVTFEHYYRVDIFMSALDKQLYDLNNRFNDQVMEMLKLSSTLVPNKVFNIHNICLLVEKYYSTDFTEQERIQLKYELELFFH
ncbi:zinc finger MYM-type protein 1-like protein [Tanacetum coccineum]